MVWHLYQIQRSAILTRTEKLRQIIIILHPYLSQECPTDLFGCYFWNVCSKGSQIIFLLFWRFFVRNVGCLLPGNVFQNSCRKKCANLAGYFCVFFVTVWFAAGCWKLSLKMTIFWLNGTILSSSRGETQQDNTQQVKEMEKGL